jgi:predicted cupin superfamily sugar epimerase
MKADDVIAALGLQPHPEGGFYVETFRSDILKDGRATSTAIYFLLRAGERSRWHRVDADEIWLWHAGAPLTLLIGDAQMVLGADIAAGQRPHGVVPAHQWQAAESQGDWTLVSCVVAPGFEFSGFEFKLDDAPTK